MIDTTCLECTAPIPARKVNSSVGIQYVHRMTCPGVCTERRVAFLGKPAERLPEPVRTRLVGQTRRIDGPRPHQAMPAGRPVHVDAVKWCRGCDRSLSIDQFAQKVQHGRNRGRRRYCIECNRRDEMSNS